MINLAGIPGDTPIAVRIESTVKGERSVHWPNKVDAITLARILLNRGHRQVVIIHYIFAPDSPRYREVSRVPVYLESEGS